MIAFAKRTLEELSIDDERSFRPVGLYADLRRILVDAKYVFRVLPEALAGRWDRALLLNLTFWGASEGGDVLDAPRIDADVVAHAAWHHLAGRHLIDGPRASADALFLGESIASAFDVYLVGRLLVASPDASFLESQVPAMQDAAEAGGLDEAGFATLLQSLADDPERAFEDLRELLFDATRALFDAPDADAALTALATFDGHRFAPLLSRYELSNWTLYARTYGTAEPDARAREIDRALREAPDAVAWLDERWVRSA